MEHGCSRPGVGPRAWEPERFERIAALDPLSADDALATLPRLNDAEAIDDLLSMLAELCRRVPEDPSFDVAAACMRDLGILLGSVRRRGVQPCERVAGLEATLVRLGRAQEMTPRDTVLHYCLCNPRGTRERHYTRDPLELTLIDAVRELSGIIYPCLDELFSLPEQLRDEDLPTLERIVERLSGLPEMFVRVKASVTGPAFREVLRPFFEPIDVDGRTWCGPGAVETPLFLVDRLLWGEVDDATAQFTDLYLHAQLPYVRRHARSRLMHPSVLSRSTDTPEVRSRVCALVEDALRSELRFRGPHLKLAQSAYVAGASFEKGSGGLPPNEVLSMARATKRALGRSRRPNDAL